MPLSRKSPIKRASIRTLQPNEPVPAGEPKRYRNSAGYVRLRWKVGPQQYVEVYEHRLVAGLPDADVHHRDHSKDNNDLTNLEILSKQDHASHHGEESAARSRRVTEWDGQRSQDAYQKRQRRLARVAERKAFLDRVVALYSAGRNTVEIGEEVGRDSSNISRALRAVGIAPAGQAKKASGQVSTKVRSIVQARAQMHCEICSANLLWASGQVHHRKPRGMGGSRVPERHEPQNLLFVCVECHRSVESRRAEALASGWLVPSGIDPAKVAVLIKRDRWCYLTDDGGYADAPPEVAA